MSSILENIDVSINMENASVKPDILFQDRNVSQAVATTKYLPNAGVANPTGSCLLTMRNELRKGGVRHVAISAKFNQPYGTLTNTGTAEEPALVLVNGKLFEANITCSMTLRPLPTQTDAKLRESIADQVRTTGIAVSQAVLNNFDKLLVGAV